MISAEEEVILTVKIRAGDESALKKMVLANLRFVVSVAKQYQNLGLSLPDLINEGNVGLVKAAKRFDETRGFKFISYAVWWIRQAIIQAIAEQSRIIRLPLNKIGMLNKIKKAGAVLEQQLERNVSPAEIAENLSLSEDDVKTVQRVSSFPSSVDSPVGEGEGTFMDVMFDPENPLPDHELMSSSLAAEISRALSKLSKRDEEVVRLFFGINVSHSHSLGEIAATLGLTRERVRQIKESAIRRLRANTQSRQLRTYLG